MALLKGGGSVQWSAECIAALMACHYDPGDFGDYKYVQDRIKSAKARVDKHNAWDKPGAKPPAPPCTKADRFLAESQSGHIVQDATQREAGGRSSKFNACGNRVDGYDSNKAACMPHHGSAGTKGTQHNIVSEQEDLDARKKGRGTDDAYPRDDVNADSKERTKKAIEHRAKAQNEPGQSPTSDAYKGKGPKYFDPKSADGASDGDAVAGGTADASSQAGPTPSNVDKAAECIDAFREKADEAMKKPWMSENTDADGNSPAASEKDAYNGYQARLAKQKADADAKSAAANTSGKKNDVKNAKRRLGTAQKNEAAVGSELKTSQKRRSDQTKARDSATTPEEKKKYQDRLDATNSEITDLEGKRKTAQDKVAIETANVKQEDPGAAESADATCKSDQAKRLWNSQQQPPVDPGAKDNPRVPRKNGWLASADKKASTKPSTSGGKTSD